MKNLFLVPFCLLIAFTAFAAKDKPPREKRTHHLVLSGGSSMLRVKDGSVSPNVYHGILLLSSIGQEGEKAGQLGMINGGFKFGTVKYKLGNMQMQHCYSFSIDAVRTWEFRKGHRTQFFAGPLFSMMAALRNPNLADNNFLTYDIPISLGAAGIVRRDFRIFSRDWQIRYTLEVPALSYLIRPSYTGPYPEGYLENGVYNDNGRVGFAAAIKSGSLATFNHYMRLDNYFALSYPLKKNRNELRLSYNWDFYRASLHDKTALSGSQALYFCLLIHL